MRTSSFIVCLLVLAQSALTGDIHHAKKQATPAASIDLARLPKEISARIAEIQTQITHASTPFSAGTTLDRSSLVPALPDRQRIKEMNAADRIGAAPAPSRALNVQQEPYDTVYVWNPTITHRYLYSRDVNGRLESLVSQYQFGGKWVDQEKTSWTYDNQISIVRESAPLGTIIERTVESTYGQGRRSHVYEAMSANTCRLELVFKDSTIMDENGRKTFSQSEQWNDGFCRQGTRLRTEYLGHMTIEESQNWTPLGWQNLERTTRVLGQVPEQPCVIVQRWTGSTWIDDYRVVWMADYTIGSLSQGTRTEVWEEGTWTAILRTISRSEDGLTGTTISESWTGDRWNPYSKEVVAYDEQGLSDSTTVYEWQDGWIMRLQTSSARELDGGYRREEAYWSNGQLSFTVSARSGPIGNWLFYESQYWNNGVVIAGWRETRQLDPEGREREVLHSSCENGAWEWDDRYAMAYDAQGRLVSVDHFAWEESQWVNSARTRKSSPPSWPGISGGNSDGFNEFSRISFCYRDAATAVEPGMGTLPATTELMQNYPNPGNPNSDIRYLISEFGNVRLAVYDMLGREVALLVNEMKPAGAYEVRFDASGLASGVYLYRLTAGSFVETRKMIVLR